MGVFNAERHENMWWTTKVSAVFFTGPLLHPQSEPLGKYFFEIFLFFKEMTRKKSRKRKTPADLFWSPTHGLSTLQISDKTEPKRLNAPCQKKILAKAQKGPIFTRLLAAWTQKCIFLWNFNAGE
jgi:hypothetical protein